MQGPTDLPARGLLSVDDQPCFFIARVDSEGLEDTPFDRAALGLDLRGPDRSDPPEGQGQGGVIVERSGPINLDLQRFIVANTNPEIPLGYMMSTSQSQNSPQPVRRRTS